MTQQEAIAEAVKTLREHGFEEQGGLWHGKLRPAEDLAIDVRIKLPARFPQNLPQIEIDSLKQLPRQMAHVQPNRLICVAAPTGVLINADDPRGLVRGVIERATEVLRRGLSGESDSELIAEFLAYWAWGSPKRIASIVPLGRSSQVLLYAIKKPNVLQVHDGILAADAESATRWAQRVGVSLLSSVEAYLLSLSEPILPPMAEDDLFEVGDFVEILRSRTPAPDWAEFELWLRSVILPITVAFTFKVASDQSNVLAGAVIPNRRGDIQGGGRFLFRPTQQRAIAEIQRVTNSPVERLHIDRFDPGFLVPRAGADTNLLSHSCALIGVGAVGSQLAEMLASLGIGKLQLVDGDVLTNENVHRHVLGMASIHKNKAIEMAQHLTRKFPHLTFDATPEPIQTQLERDPEFLTRYDLVINATGDETLGIELNSKLYPKFQQIHTWLDPLGIGGHALYVHPAPQKGCYRCLFRTDEKDGMYNAASLAARGQNFVRSFSGCGGGFTPFSAVDSIRTGIEAARLAADVLTHNRNTPVLHSWRGPEEEFIRAGFRLSQRAAMIRPGCMAEVLDFAEPSCPVCGVPQ